MKEAVHRTLRGGSLRERIRRRALGGLTAFQVLDRLPPSIQEELMTNPNATLARREAVQAVSSILEQLVDDMRDHRAMVDAIESLEGDKRRVFELVSEEHSGPEIAETLGVPLNTVYSRLRLARGQIVREARRLREAPQAAAQAA